MRRRHFLKLTLGGTGLLIGCATDDQFGSVHLLVAESEVDDEPSYVTMYDTYAQALYYDGTEGPKTGIIKVDFILADLAITLDFWHGHGGKQHRFEVTPAHFAELKAGTRVYIQTTVVDNHSHKLFIDPVNPKYRVPGAQPVMVPLGGTELTF